MTDDATDIREWAKAKGIDIGERGRIPADVRKLYNEDASAPVVDMPDVPPPSEETPPRTERATGETPPGPPPPRPKWWQRKPHTEPRDRRAHKRVPLETWAARAWKGLAYVTGAGATPTSRCLNMQAPVAGIIVDDMLKGTAVDMMLQPLARMGEGGKDVAALVGLPLLVAVTERQPMLYPYTRPLMAEAATEWVLIAGPAMRKAKARAAKVAEELAEFELDEDAVEGAFAAPVSNPVIEKMLDAIFAPMMPTPATVEPEPAAAGAA